MTPNHFNKSLKYLNLSVYAAAPILGISLRQAQRYSSGEDPQDVSEPVARFLSHLQREIFQLKVRHHELSQMIQAIDQGGVRIGTKSHDATRQWRDQLQAWMNDAETLLRKHPSGIPSQLD